jgi:glucosamine-6-phosphate deaminase
MNIIKAVDQEQLHKIASEFIIDRIKQNPNNTIGFATGGSPQGTYQKLIEDYKQNKTSYRNLKSFNLDEYVGLHPSNPNSYRYYMEKRLFNHIDIQERNIHIPNGMARDLEEECYQYENWIDKVGGIDLQILGIGRNGHIGFNEPGTSFDSLTHIVELSSSTRQANARYFRSIEEVPTHAITMGIVTILKSKEILLLASGHEKSHAINRLLSGEINQQFPSSVLRSHTNVTIIADAKALAQATSNLFSTNSTV